MTRSAFAVIGAGHGDEGKGKAVDAIAHALGRGTVVVRSNGGAQAGHTVVTPQGRRHVFHHLGSGALAGATTHLSRFMVSHPMLLADEVRAVAALGGVTAITADPRGFVTTPWDMMANQAAEVARGERRHGSCGLGFGETVGRSEDSGFVLTVADLARTDLPDRLAAIRDQWLPARLAALGVEAAGAGGGFLAAAHAPALLARFVEDCRIFADLVDTRDDADLGAADALVFEAAQGLLLDQRHRDFPFVTRSNTGITNMLTIAGTAGIDRIDAYYATRCYATRHGRGPMTDERDIAGHFNVRDATNLPNPWQETLRMGLLDVDLLAATIGGDLAHAASGGVEVTHHLAVSCLDQAVGRVIRFVRDGVAVSRDVPAFLATLRALTRATMVVASAGPTRDAVPLRIGGGCAQPARRTYPSVETRSTAPDARRVA